MASTQDPIQSPRRRRRAARRAAGPPSDGAAAPAAVPTAPAPPDQVPSDRLEQSDALTTAPAGSPSVAGPSGGHGSPGDAPTHPPGSAHAHAGTPGHGGHGQPRDRTAEQQSGPSSQSGDVRRPRTPREDAAERSLRSLVTTRSTQVSPTAAMRAREVALPSDEDLAAAEADLVIVRRHYVPPTALATGRRPERPPRRGTTAQNK